MTRQELSVLLDRARFGGGHAMSAEDWGSPTRSTPPMVLDLTDRWPTRPRRAMSALETLRVTLNSIPRHAMGGKRARALNGIGLGCTAEPRRAR